MCAAAAALCRAPAARHGLPACKPHVCKGLFFVDKHLQRTLKRCKRLSGPCKRLFSTAQFFDLNDLENTIGSWDMYGQEDKNRYNSLQARNMGACPAWGCAFAANG